MLLVGHLIELPESYYMISQDVSDALIRLHIALRHTGNNTHRWTHNLFARPPPHCAKNRLVCWEWSVVETAVILTLHWYYPVTVTLVPSLIWYVWSCYDLIITQCEYYWAGLAIDGCHDDKDKWGKHVKLWIHTSPSPSLVSSTFNKPLWTGWDMLEKRMSLVILRFLQIHRFLDLAPSLGQNVNEYIAFVWHGKHQYFSVVTESMLALSSNHSCSIFLQSC